MSENIIFKGMNAILGRLLDGPPILKTAEELQQEIEESYVLDPSELTPVRNSLGYRVSPIKKGIHMGFGHSYISPYINDPEELIEAEKTEYKPLTKEARHAIINCCKNSTNLFNKVYFDGQVFGIYIDSHDVAMIDNIPEILRDEIDYIWFKNALYTYEDVLECGPFY